MERMMKKKMWKLRFLSVVRVLKLIAIRNGYSRIPNKYQSKKFNFYQENELDFMSYF